MGSLYSHSVELAARMSNPTKTKTKPTKTKTKGQAAQHGGEGVQICMCIYILISTYTNKLYRLTYIYILMYTFTLP